MLIQHFNTLQHFKRQYFKSYCANFIYSRSKLQMPYQSLLYDYGSVFANFPHILEQNKLKALTKKQEYLQKIMSIFRQFVKKCEKQIDSIIETKITKLLKNYEHVSQYFEQNDMSRQSDDQSLMIAEFLIKPFQRFPFSGNKNQKLFKQQYNLIQKASVLIQQTLIDSFNEDEIPSFSNEKFFSTLTNHGLGSQSLTKLRINPQNFSIQPLYDILPQRENTKAIKILNKSLAMLINDSRCIQFWDLDQKICIKQLFVEVLGQISYSLIFASRTNYLVLGFGDQNPKIITYRMDNWQRYGCNVAHTKKVTKLLQFSKKYLISGSHDGNVCIHEFSHLKTVHQSPHISSIEDIILKSSNLYVLLKCSTVCEYQIRKSEEDNQPILQFRRTLSAGYISLIRFPEVTSNFVGVACHIYGLSQIQITRKFKIEEINIINIAEMIADFIILQSKQTSEFFAICCFQNSSAIKIYSLLSQSLVYEIENDYSGEVGVGNYMPKLEITYFGNKYILGLIIQSQFSEDKNIVRLFELKL